jgi:thiamine-monophosphate kinase
LADGAGVVALHVPPDTDDRWLSRLYDGMNEAAGRWGLDVAGGDIVTSPVLALSITLAGSLDGRSPLTRDAARPGDRVVLVVEVGLAAAGLALRRAGHDDFLAAHPELLERHRRPLALLEAGVALAESGARGCIDVSDGLGRDAGHLARASRARVVLEEDRIPLSEPVREAQRLVDDDLLAVAGGEDFALVATVAEPDLDAVSRHVREAGHDVVVIGRVEEGDGVVLVRPDGRTVDADRLGYEHAQGGR